MLSWGAILASLRVPGADGTPGEVVLGFDDLESGLFDGSAGPCTRRRIIVNDQNNAGFGSLAHAGNSEASAPGVVSVNVLSG